MTGPPVPKLDGDLMLDVYTHRSLQGSDEPSTTDNMRLAELGEQVMRLVVTWVLFSRRPPLSADDIESERTQYLSEANVNSWVSRYSMRSKVRVAPGQQGILDSPEVR
jgi:dsRNA-specific ribonuclease